MNVNKNATHWLVLRWPRRVMSITQYNISHYQFQLFSLQWNLSIMVAHGPEKNGCNREVAALKKCLVYGILPIGA